MSISLERLQSLFLRELAVIVNEDRKIEGQMYFNITEVKISKDRSVATVYYTILSDESEDLELAENILTQLNKQIRLELSQKVRNIKRMPELKFRFDEALAYGNRIEKILKELNTKTE